MANIPLARDFMAKTLHTLKADAPIFEAIELLLRHRVSGAPVVDAAGKLVGVLSEKDCLRVFANGAFHQLAGGIVSDYMSRQVFTVAPDDDVFKVADIFLKNSFRRLPVVDNDILLGQISRRDVLMAAKKICSESPARKTWSDSKYLTDEMKAALEVPAPDKPTQ